MKRSRLSTHSADRELTKQKQPFSSPQEAAAWVWCGRLADAERMD